MLVTNSAETCNFIDQQDLSAKFKAGMKKGLPAALILLDSLHAKRNPHVKKWELVWDEVMELPDDLVSDDDFVERCMGHAAFEDDEVCVVTCLLEECMVTLNFCPVEYNYEHEWVMVAAPAA